MYIYISHIPVNLYCIDYGRLWSLFTIKVIVLRKELSETVKTACRTRISSRVRQEYRLPDRRTSCSRPNGRTDGRTDRRTQKIHNVYIAGKRRDAIIHHKLCSSEAFLRMRPIASKLVKILWARLDGQTDWRTDRRTEAMHNVRGMHASNKTWP